MEMGVMGPEVTIAEAKDGYRLWLSFSDGLMGEIDLAKDLWGLAFVELRDPSYFAKASVDHVLGTVVWPNGVDFAPEWLYERVLEGAAA